MTWLYLLSLFSGVLGFFSGAFGLRTIRSREHPQAEIAWKQLPFSPWRYETLTVAVILLHSLGLICLAVFLTLSVVRNTMTASFMQLDWVLVLALASQAFTCYMAGVVLAFHLIQHRIKPVSHGISQDGLWYGGSLIGWKSYSHYEADGENGFISLYSSYSPSLRTWVIQPPPESFSQVLATIQQNLPSTRFTDESISWRHSPAILILGMMALVLGGLIPAIWGWLNGETWLWFYCLVAFFLVLVIGNQWITVFDGRGQPIMQKELGTT